MHFPKHGRVFGLDVEGVMDDAQAELNEECRYDQQSEALMRRVKMFRLRKC